MSLASRLLPITRRGLFSEDDFFKDFQTDYSSAVTDVLDRWGGRSLLADQFTNYRKARQLEPEDDNSLAASISETPEGYVIVLDMTDFISGEISVRTHKLNAVVDAKVGTSKKFHRSYPLPADTNTEAVVAAMSDEGILTINAKRKTSKTSKQLEAASSVDTSDSNLPNFISSLKIDVGQTDDSSGSGSQPSSPSATSQSAASATLESELSSTENDKQLPISRRGQFFKDAFFENVWKDFDSAMEDMVSRQRQRQEVKQEERQNRELARREIMEKMIMEEEEQRRRLKAERVERQRKASQEMQEQMKLFQRPTMDRLSSYRSLRSWTGPGEDSQAATVTADEAAYKVVLDMKDFTDGDLDLKSDGEALTVTGAKGGVTCKREFSLPGLSAPEHVTASLSEDGILTITAPRKQ